MPGDPYVKIVMSGCFGDPGAPYEIWTAGLAMSSLPAGKQAQVATTLATTFASPNCHIQPSVHLLDVAVAYLGANHKQIGDTVHFAQTGVNGGGTGGGGNMPPQVALRVSLDSGQRGRSQKGGFYLPTPALSPSTGDGLVSSGPALEVAQLWAATIGTLNGLDAGHVVVPSSVAGNVVVSRVRVGRALDTIRRRRNNLNEAYATATPAP